MGNLKPEVRDRGNRNLQKGTWSSEEDARLQDAVKRHGTGNWATISEHVRTRDRKSCSNRWHRNLKREVRDHGGQNLKVSRQRRKQQRRPDNLEEVETQARVAAREAGLGSYESTRAGNVARNNAVLEGLGFGGSSTS